LVFEVKKTGSHCGGGGLWAIPEMWARVDESRTEKGRESRAKAAVTDHDDSLERNATEFS
jgi:hypothetical protein